MKESDIVDRKILSARVKPKMAILIIKTALYFSFSCNKQNFIILNISYCQVPFGLSVVNNDLYISDWKLGLLSVSNPGSNPSSYSVADAGWAEKTPMGLDYSTVSESLGKPE